MCQFGGWKYHRHTVDVRPRVCSRVLFERNARCGASALMSRTYIPAPRSRYIDIVVSTEMCVTIVIELHGFLRAHSCTSADDMHRAGEHRFTHQAKRGMHHRVCPTRSACCATHTRRHDWAHTCGSSFPSGTPHRREKVRIHASHSRRGGASAPEASTWGGSVESTCADVPLPGG